MVLNVDVQRLGADLHAGHKSAEQHMSWTKLMVDEILGRYGLEMTWSIKKGIMGKGKSEFSPFRAQASLTGSRP